LPKNNVLKTLTESLSPTELDQVMTKISKSKVNPVVNLSFKDKKEADEFFEKVKGERVSIKSVKEPRKKTLKENADFQREKRRSHIDKRRKLDEKEMEEEYETNSSKINLRKRRGEKEPTVTFSKNKEPLEKKRFEYDSDDYDLF
jgi:hypothetical protein